VALTVSSLVTSFWIVATLSDPVGVFQASDINYGLFVGQTSGYRVTKLDMDLSSKPRSQQALTLLAVMTVVTSTTVQQVEQRPSYYSGRKHFCCSWQENTNLP
jgi:hypothetical protein